MAWVNVANIRGPTGATGSTGAQGPTGAPGVGFTWRGTWSGSTAYAINDCVQRTNQSYICTVANTGNDPASDVTHWNLMAAQGGTGATGPAGPTGENANTLTVANFTVPAVGATVTVSVADTGWIVVGQVLYVDTAGGGAGLAGAFQVQSKTSTTVTLLNPAQLQQIPLASSAQAGLLAQLSGGSSYYVGGDNATHPMPTIGAFKGVTSTYSVVAADNASYLICSGGNWTMTLPAATLGFSVTVRNDQGITGTTGTITIQGVSGATINGLASLALLPGQECTFIADGTNWRARGLQRVVVLGTQDVSAVASGTILLPLGYRLFELDFESLQSSVDNTHLCAQMSNNGGSTWDTSAGYWYGNVYHNATAPLGSGPTATTQAYFGWYAGSGSGYFQAHVKLSPGRTGQYATYISDASSWATAESFLTRSLHGGLASTAAPINALKYFMSSGNIANSLLTVRGIV